MGEFFDVWLSNTLKYTKPRDIYVIGDKLPNRNDIKKVEISDNLGHVMRYPKIDDKQYLCGWSAVALIGCMIAYASKCDVIYKEQDCLAFGDWVGKMNEELGEGRMAVGKTLKVSLFDQIVYF